MKYITVLVVTGVVAFAAGVLGWLYRKPIIDRYGKVRQGLRVALAK